MKNYAGSEKNTPRIKNQGKGTGYRRFFRHKRKIEANGDQQESGMIGGSCLSI
jgi:hypothetical protein